MQSNWRPVAGYEGIYAVNRDGAVRSVRNGRIMSPVPNSDGYLTVKLYRAGKGTRYRIHRLVCAAFNGPSQGDATDVAHLDGDKLNLAATNLAWVTRAENEGHKTVHGTKASGERNGRAKLTAADVMAIKALYASGLSYAMIGTRFGIHPSTAHRAATGARYRSDDGPARKGDAKKVQP